jgi:hypothetical protein
MILSASIAASANSGPSVNAYFVALIAVLGTALGAAISALTQMLTTRRSSAHQLAVLRLQLDHQTSEAVRQDRREAYIRFLLARDRWALLTLYTSAAVHDKEELPEDQGLDAEYAAARTQLDLFAGKKLARLAGNSFSQDMADMRAARKGENPENHQTEGYVPPTELIAAMQEELLVDGVPIDPATGFRVWDVDSNA